MSHPTMPQGSAVGGVARANGICMLAMIAWAIGFPASEVLLETWDPLALIAARLAMAVTVLVPIWALIDGPRAVLFARWRRGTLVGGIGFGLGTYLLLLGQSLSDPVLVAIIASSMPVAAAFLEVTLDGRRLTRTFIAGISVSVLGGAVATASGQGGISGVGMGALAALGSAFLFAWGSRAAVKDFPELTSLGQTTITLGGGLVFTAVAFLFAQALGQSAVPQGINAHQITMLAIYALGAMALSQVLWIIGVGRLGVAVASLHINTAPFYVMLILFALGAPWNSMQALGAGAVAFGVFLAQRR